jgi:hypothetical protein
MLARISLVLCILCNTSGVMAADRLKFDCTGTIDSHGATALKDEPKISGGELEIDMGKQELLLTTLQPMGAIYGKFIEATDILIRFRTPDGITFGGINRTTGDLMITNMKTDVIYWLKCKLRKPLF